MKQKNKKTVVKICVYQNMCISLRLELLININIRYGDYEKTILSFECSCFDAVQLQ